MNFVDETGTWAYDVHAGYYKTQNINKTNRKDGLILTEKISKTSNSKFVYSGRKYVYIPYIGDSKYYGTYYWAIECGISADKAKIIAYHCNGVDNLFKGVSWLPYLGDQSWHFNTNWGTKSKDSRDINSNAYIKKAKEAFNKGNIEDGLKKLGMALHPIQDKYAHTREVCTYNIVPITALTNSGRYETYYVEFWYHPKKNKKGVFVDSAKQRSGQLNKAKNETKKILNEMVKRYPILKK